MCNGIPVFVIADFEEHDNSESIPACSPNIFVDMASTYCIRRNFRMKLFSNISKITSHFRKYNFEIFWRQVSKWQCGSTASDMMKRYSKIFFSKS